MKGRLRVSEQAQAGQAGRALIDHGLRLGWVPATRGVTFQITSGADVVLPGFVLTDLLWTAEQHQTYPSVEDRIPEHHRSSSGNLASTSAATRARWPDRRDYRTSSSLAGLTVARLCQRLVRVALGVVDDGQRCRLRGWRRSATPDAAPPPTTAYLRTLMPPVERCGSPASVTVRTPLRSVCLPVGPSSCRSADAGQRRGDGVVVTRSGPAHRGSMSSLVNVARKAPG